VTCNLCGEELGFSKSTPQGLQKHLLQDCPQATAEIKQQLTQRSAAKINKQAAAAAAEAAGAGTKRRSSTGSKTGSSSGSSLQQMTIGHYSVGSKENQLLPAQRAVAHQHLLRAIVTGGVAFRVGAGTL
jgi:hypothetical protein